jgi:hypothetical protein
MAQIDWTEVAGNLDSSTVAKGVTAGTTPPNGGSSFVYGFNSLATTTGAVGLYVNATGNSGANALFAPMQTDANVATGGSVRAAMVRGISAEPQTGFAPMVYINLKSGLTSNPNVNDTAYLLGLEDANPHRIVLRKGPLNGGLSVDNSLSTLAVSSSAYNPGTWVHLRLDAIYNQNGDVVLLAFQNDLTVNSVTTPAWVPVPGIATVIDDALSVNTGTTPLAGGFAGFAFYTAALQKRAYFDQVQVLRQK